MLSILHPQSHKHGKPRKRASTEGVVSTQASRAPESATSRCGYRLEAAARRVGVSSRFAQERGATPRG